ncbi:MAG: 50S ribosomal protein L3 [Patescibacteria group bacterium]
MNTLLAIKKATHQNWTSSGKRIPVTVLSVGGNVVISKAETKTTIGFGKKKDSRSKKPQLAMLKKLGIAFGVKTIREISGTTERLAGDTIVPFDVFTVGDIVKVTGTSKGMGFAGVVKKYGFAGGPKTHGQSDRERAPGSIGNRTTPGRVFKNKRMSGRGGNKTVTVENMQVVAINNETYEIWVKGLVPGAIHNMVSITKVREGKFEGLFDRKKMVAKIETVEMKEETPTVVEPELKEEPKEEVRVEEKK